MQISLTTQEEPEIIVNPEDLPNFRLAQESSQEEDAQSKGLTPLEIAKNFILELRSALEKGDTDELLYLYDRKFKKISDSTFKDKEWPQTQEIEQTDDDLEIDFDTTVLYNELGYRHVYGNRNLSFGPEFRLNSYNNYIGIFESILNSKEEMTLPIPWIWDIMDEFLYQYQTFCQYRAKLSKDSPDMEVLLKEPDSIWTLNKILEILNNLVEKGKVLENGKLRDPPTQKKTAAYFGYYALVSLLRIHVITGDYDAAIKVIEPIDFKRLSIFTKAFPCLISLFYYAGFTYLMKKRAKESVKLFELALSCFIKYKQFYSKSFQFEAMTRLAEKTLLLLGIALVFYPVSIDENVMANLREKFGDKLEKLQKYDLTTFQESFTYGCPKFIVPIKDIDNFKNFGFDLDISEIVNKQRDALSQEFTKIQQLNNLTGVLKLYDTIKLEKLAKMMNVSVNDMKNLIQLYQERNSPATKDVPFEQTIVKKILESVKSLDFTIDNGVLKVNAVSDKPNFTKIFYRNIHKIEEITHDIKNL